MTSNIERHLACYPCTWAGSRALENHLRDDHGKTLYTGPYEDHAAHSAMHAAAHADQAAAETENPGVKSQQPRRPQPAPTTAQPPDAPSPIRRRQETMDTIPTPVRCAVYLRVIPDPAPERLQIELQRAACETAALERGWRVVREYADDLAGGRPGYDQMTSDHRAGQFDAVIAWDLDLLAPQPRQLEDWAGQAGDRGLLIATANGKATLPCDTLLITRRKPAAHEEGPAHLTLLV